MKGILFAIAEVIIGLQQVFNTRLGERYRNGKQIHLSRNHHIYIVNTLTRRKPFQNLRGKQVYVSRRLGVVIVFMR